jgi:hypothetical protein
MTLTSGPYPVFQFIVALHPTNDVHLTECRWYPNNGYMVHYSIADQGTVNYWRDVIAFIEHTGDRGELGLRWSHDLDRQPKPRPVAPDENIGSCEPSPLILWDKTGGVWHTDTAAGRYSIRRLGKRQPYGAFLNNKPISNVRENLSVDVIKREVEHRIRTARRIAETV